MVRVAVSLFTAALAAACSSPTVDGADFTGDEQSCTAALSCQGGDCGGASYSFTCTLNAATDLYDCICQADGVDGDTFSEAGVCALNADGGFANLDLADASEHAVVDCDFPVQAAEADAD